MPLPCNYLCASSLVINLTNFKRIWAYLIKSIVIYFPRGERDLRIITYVNGSKNKGTIYLFVCYFWYKKKQIAHLPPTNRHQKKEHLTIIRPEAVLWVEPLKVLCVILHFK